MKSYRELTKYFGASMWDPAFQNILKQNFTDLSTYDVTESAYIISKASELELGFTNDQAIFDEDDRDVFEKGNPIFSHVNIYSISRLTELPFAVEF